MITEKQPGVLRSSQNIQHQITKEVGYNNETSSSQNMDKTVSFISSSSNQRGTKDLFDNRSRNKTESSTRKRAPLSKQMRQLSFKTDRYAEEQNDSISEQSNYQNKTRPSQIRVLRTSSESIKPTGESPTEHPVARMIKSLEEKEQSGSTGSQSPSRLDKH
ncbi:unnamed protein product [Mytilus coruscus]|uniref:Uncharacterized protein n=1 Tax=Mytilus coruscus TaxID=42192 RepID=A0A6J8DNW9_MYTCO|nr:unnamed protein product [Mytilus coruscus]